MKLVVSGGRNVYLSAEGYKLLGEIIREYNIEEVCTGENANGIDRCVKEYCKQFNIKYKGFPAKWILYGSKAGPLRNAEMLQYITKDGLLILFTGGRGTLSALKEGIKVDCEIKNFMDRKDLVLL